MFWATVILSAGMLSGGSPESPPELRPNNVEFQASNSGLMDHARVVARDRGQLLARNSEKGKAINQSQNPSQVVRTDRGSPVLPSGQISKPGDAPKEGFSPGFLQDLKDGQVQILYPDSNGLSALQTAGKSERGRVLLAEKGLLKARKLRKNSSVPMKNATVARPMEPLLAAQLTEHRSQYSTRNTVARLPVPVTLAFKPQIERLCRYVEEQSRRGSTSVGHEKTEPRSERSGDLPSARNTDQLGERGSSPILCKESAGESCGFRSFCGVRTLYPVREALSLHGKKRGPGQREAEAGDRKQEAGWHRSQEKSLTKGRRHAKEIGSGQEESFKEELYKPINLSLWQPGNASGNRSMYEFIGRPFAPSVVGPRKAILLF